VTLLKNLQPSLSFRNFALSARSYLQLEEKTNTFVLFFSRFSVTLEEFAGFLYIKAVWEIEDFEGYG
jgi:hypothetical protein